MKVMVTGGAGFIGSHLTDTLVNLGHQVVIVDDLSTGSEKNINKSAKFYKADVSNIKKLEGIFKKEQIEVIFHTAAQIDVRVSSANPERDAEVNIIGTINLLKCAAENGCRKLIFSSTGGAMYGNVYEPAGENIPPNPKAPYGISKYSAEMYIRFFCDEYKLQSTILRYANVYGPRQSIKGEAGVVAIFINSIMDNKDITFYGFGNMERDFVYIDDIVEANILAVNAGNKQTYNVGTGKKTSVKDLFGLISAHFPEYSGQIIKKEKRPGELDSSVLDNNMLRKDFEKSDYVQISQGIENTVKWFREYRNG